MKLKLIATSICIICCVLGVYSQELKPAQDSSNYTLSYSKAVTLNSQYLVHLDSFFDTYSSAHDTLSIDSLILLNKKAFSYYEQSNHHYQIYYQALITQDSSDVPTALLETKNTIYSSLENAYNQAALLKQKAHDARTSKKQLQLLWESENWKSFGNNALLLLLELDQKTDVIGFHQETSNPLLARLYHIQDSIHSNTRQWPFKSSTVNQENQSKALHQIEKHYSPFSNITDTFYVAAPTPEQSKKLSTVTLSEEQELKPSYTKQKDHAIEDSLSIAKISATQNRITHDSVLDSRGILPSNNQFFHQSNLSFTKTGIREAWNNYMGIVDNDLSLSSKAQQIKDTSSSFHLPNVNTKDQPTYTAEAHEPQDKKLNNTISQTDNKNKISTDNVQYYIQIAACRDEMSKENIKILNTNNRTLTYRFEDNWHKYQIAASENYRKALTILKEVEISGAFIVAYRENYKLNLWETLKETQVQIATSPSIQFMLQIAASRSPLSPNEVRELNRGADKIRMIREDGWYKYQIVIGTSYQLTLEKWRMIGISKSFPVAYRNNQKTNMSDALQTQGNQNNK